MHGSRIFLRRLRSAWLRKTGDYTNTPQVSMSEKERDLQTCAAVEIQV
jgi:hypothetical protein